MAISIEFDRDPEKATSNLAKHGVSFVQAISARKPTRNERRQYEDG